MLSELVVEGLPSPGHCLPWVPPLQTVPGGGGWCAFATGDPRTFSLEGVCARNGTTDQDGAPIPLAGPDRLDPHLPGLARALAPAEQPPDEPLQPSRHGHGSRRGHPPATRRATDGRVDHARRPDG